MRRLLIVGAGGHGRAVAEAAVVSSQFDLVGFLDDAADPLVRVWERPVLGTVATLRQHAARVDCAIVAIGNNRVREHLHKQLYEAGVERVTVIHPRSVIAPSALVGAGCAIMAGAIIGTQAQLGEGVIVNCGAVVDHHCAVEDYAHLGTGACMAGGSILRRGAWLQAGACIGYGVEVEAGSQLEPGEGRSAGK